MYQERIGRVLAAMEQMGLEQMIVSDPDSIWYLTGYYVFPIMLPRPILGQEAWAMTIT